MAKEVGERVGCILSSHGGTVKFLGYGTYVGDEVPAEAVGFLARVCQRNGLSSPKIVLDDGDVVYGCECWWALEERCKRKLADFETVERVSISAARAAYLAEHPGDEEEEEEEEADDDQG